MKYKYINGRNYKIKEKSDSKVCGLCRGAGWYRDPTQLASCWGENMVMRMMNERICGCDAGKNLEMVKRMSE